MLRGSRDFSGRDAYVAFLKGLFGQLNAGRQVRLAEEVPLLRPLPPRRLEAFKRLRVRVEAGSTVRVEGNVYSVPSRLIGEWVEAHLYAERVELWYAQKRVEELPRLRGRGKHRINYRHVIDWLIRKPGAFADYPGPRRGAGRPVPQQSLPHGLRLAGPAAASPGRQG